MYWLNSPNNYHSIIGASRLLYVDWVKTHGLVSMSDRVVVVL
jgi:hypothetical protein